MIANSLQMVWTAGMRELCNHLWQSTVFAGIVLLLTLALRRYQARMRYWLWMAASVKLLIPFSLLAAVVSHLQWITRANDSQTGPFTAMHQMSQPFTELNGLGESFTSLAAPTASHSSPVPLGLALAVVWLSGSLTVFFFWLVQWRRISKSVRAATPLRSGREVEALRRMERIARLRRKIEIIPLTDAMEPGVFGIRRSVLLWPDGISRHLDDAHLEAVLAHEVCHVRWRDNLTSAVHMLVSAIFWFHPLVWWMKNQLVKERELACDEEVVNLYNKRQVYAESILTVCEFCIESPLPCVSGITGADLKKRVVQIMSGRIGLKLSPGGKLLLLASLIVAASAGVGMVGVRPSVAQTVESGKSEAKLPQSFEVVSIRPAPESSQGTISEPQGMGFRAKAMPLSVLVQMAFGINPNQMVVPKWAQGVKFDIAAKTGSDVPLTYEQMKPLMQKMLAERFGMTYHRQTQEVQGYDMVAAKGGLKLTPAKPDATKGGTGSPGSIEMPSASMQALAGMLTSRLKSPVADKTGRAGEYEVHLRFAREDDPESTLPSIFTALQEEMGIKLVSAKVPVKMVVIDHLERQPTEN
jgi:uncharacterized protein (TIGR03435 family)